MGVIWMNPRSTMTPSVRYTTPAKSPRHAWSGTEQEQAIGQKIAAYWKAFGYQVESQPFHFADALSVILALEILATQV